MARLFQPSANAGARSMTRLNAATAPSQSCALHGAQSLREERVDRRVARPAPDLPERGFGERHQLGIVGVQQRGDGGRHARIGILGEGPEEGAPLGRRSGPEPVPRLFGGHDSPARSAGRPRSWRSRLPAPPPRGPGRAGPACPRVPIGRRASPKRALPDARRRPRPCRRRIQVRSRGVRAGSIASATSLSSSPTRGRLAGPGAEEEARLRVLGGDREGEVARHGQATRARRAPGASGSRARCRSSARSPGWPRSRGTVPRRGRALRSDRP